MAEGFGIDRGVKRENLEKFKHGVRKDQLEEKQKKLFDIFDANKDGTLEGEEIGFIESILSITSGEDKVLNEAENQLASSIFSTQFGVQSGDFLGFVKSVSDAVKDIKAVTETKSSDGGRIITTTYNDGGV